MGNRSPTQPRSPKAAAKELRHPGAHRPRSNSPKVADSTGRGNVNRASTHPTPTPGAHRLRQESSGNQELMGRTVNSSKKKKKSLNLQVAATQLRLPGVQRPRQKSSGIPEPTCSGNTAPASWVPVKTLDYHNKGTMLHAGAALTHPRSPSDGSKGLFSDSRKQRYLGNQKP